MMGQPLLVSVAVLGLCWLVTGLALVLAGRGRLAGAVLSVNAVVLVSSAVLNATGHLRAAEIVLLLVTFLACVVVTAYPRVDWHSTVDVVVFTIVAAAPLVFLGGHLAGVQRDPDLSTPELAAVCVAFVVICHTWWRLERARGAERWALSWMALSAGTAGFLGALVSFALPTQTGGILVALAFTVTAPALYIGVARPEIIDVRGLVVRVVVLLTTLMAYVALFMSGAALLEILGVTSPPRSALAVLGALAALTFHPLRVLLLGVIDELLFGTRPDPLGAATHVAARIGDDPVLALRAIREALVLPYAALLVQGRPLASSGTEVTHTRSLPLALGEGRTGELVVGLRAGDLRLSESDEHVLHLATPLLAQTLRAHALADDLQSSREQSVAALEEERRRLRRDLHDGLGPRLAGIAFTADAARNALRDAPDQADELLRGLRSETADAIQEIRDLVYGMRPPALDELGLTRAIQQRVDQLRTPDGRPLRVELDVADLPPLTAAVEVAAYRIAVEALTNVARHTTSPTATVRLGLSGGVLTLEVEDAGGPGAEWQTGVGISSMRERAEELGGSLEAGTTARGGRVYAALPLVQVTPPGAPARPGR